MTAILRDRVNDLLAANADLEREVARLRYAHGAMVTNFDFFKFNYKTILREMFRPTPTKRRRTSPGLGSRSTRWSARTSSSRWPWEKQGENNN